jgi:hypothetical protein
MLSATIISCGFYALCDRKICFVSLILIKICFNFMNKLTTMATLYYIAWIKLG